MPKTEHYQWYTEQFTPTELHAHAIEETFYSGRTPFQSVAVLRTAVFGKLLVLDGDVVELAKRYLPEWSDGAFDDPRARLIIGDALRFLKDDAGLYDVVISDLTEPLPDSPSFPLFNGEVFRDIKARLVPGGVYVLQASTAGFHNMALHAKMARSLRGHFRFVRSFYTHVPAFDNDWAFLACSDEHDVAATPPERIDAYVRSLRGESWFYDAETHRRLFALPLYLRRELAKDGDVFA